MWRKPVDFLSCKKNRSGLRAEQAGNCSERCGLACSVASQERNDFPGGDGQGNLPKGLDISVKNVEAFNVQQGENPPPGRIR
jgi:hypothetical protein